MKRLMLLCLLIPIFAFGQPGEYYYAQSTGNLNFVLYTVKQQEPYKNIASLFGLSVQEVTYLNGGNIHSIANVGDQMIIPLTSKNFYRWKDIPADISAQPVYVQLKRVTDLQEIVNKYRLRADFFKRWNDTQESRFDAGAELIVGYIAFNSMDNSEERSSFDSHFSSAEGDQEMTEEPIRSYRNNYQQKEAQVNSKKQKIATAPKRVARYVDEEPIVTPKRQKVVSQPKKVVEEYMEEEEPVVAPKRQSAVTRTKPVAKEYIEEEEEPVVVSRKKQVVTKSKPAVREYIEEEEEPVIVPKKKQVVPKSKPVVKEYIVEEEEPVVVPKKKQVVPKSKPVVKEYIEEEEEPVMVPKKKQVSPKSKPVVKEYIDEEEEPVVVPKKKQVVPKSKPVVSEYDEEIPVATKKQMVKPSAKRVVEDYMEDEEPVVSSRKQKVTTKSQPVVRNDEQWEEEQEQPIAVPKKNYKAKANSDARSKSKSSMNRMDTESSSNVKKHKDTYYVESDQADQVRENISKNRSTKSSKKPIEDQTEEFLDDNQWANSNANQSKKNKYPSKTGIQKSVSEDQSDSENMDNLSDDGMALNEVPLVDASEGNDNNADTKQVERTSKQKKSTAKTPVYSEEITPNVAELAAKPEKQSQRGGRASLFMGGIAKKGGKHYVVTNLAARGETIVVTNTANGKYITAEVIGPLPVRELSKGILLKVSENAKSDLDINSNFFNVIVNY